MSDLLAQVGAEASQLWARGERVAVACSGGADSVALLHLLYRSREAHGAAISVVSVDHGLREESAEDTAFVARLAASLGLACAVHRVVCGPSEREARAARYRVFETLDVDHVALAHHADDQIETVLINLLRGTGPRGLAGMRPQRGRYVRPLLEIRRASLRTWLTEQGLPWREDPTNATDRYLRNRIRNTLLPSLEDLRPAATQAILNTRRTLAELDVFVSAEAAALGPLPWTLEAVVPRAVLRRALLDRLPGAQNRHVDQALRAIEAGRGAASLPGDRVLRIDGARIWLESE